jgi:pimeloyl-ACP methyl ester carboxylesterase
VASIYKSDKGRAIVERQYRAVLQRWPVPNRQLTIPTREGDTFVIVSGEANAIPVVLFHGSGTNSAVWIRDIAEWARPFCVYAVDMIGEPGLSAPSRPALRSEAHASWLDDVWNHLAIARARVVGMSLGGWLALDYAIRRPDRVASLSLVSPSGIGQQNRLLLVKAGLLMMLGQWGVNRSLQLVAGRTIVPREMADALTTRFQHFRPRMERLPIFTDQELASLAMPVQLILGGKDTLIRSAETRARMERCAPNLRLIYLENEGHLLPPQTAAICGFLEATVSEAEIAARRHTG